MKTALAPGSLGYTLFIWEQRQNITLRRQARHTHALGINCIFISAISESDAKCSIYHVFYLCLRLSALSPGPSEYQFIIDHSHLLLVVVHYAQCWHWNITRSGTRFARGISENHSPPVTREPGRGGAAPDNCLQSESQYKISRFGTLEHKLCKSLNKDFIIASSVVGKKCFKLDQHLSQGCK